jgi:hypothetical protein
MTNDVVIDTNQEDCICRGDLNVTLTCAEHELLNEVLMHSLEAMQLIIPYNDGLWDLPMDNSIVQRCTMIENLKERFYSLWADRFLETNLTQNSEVNS